MMRHHSSSRRNESGSGTEGEIKQRHKQHHTNIRFMKRVVFFFQGKQAEPGSSGIILETFFILHSVYSFNLKK